MVRLSPFRPAVLGHIILTMEAEALPRVGRYHRVDVALVVASAVLLCITALTIADPRWGVLHVDRALDVAVTGFTVLVALAMSVLIMPRYEADGRITWLLQMIAYGCLSSWLIYQAAVVIFRVDRGIGLSLVDPGEAPAWAALVTRAAVAALLFAAGVAAVRGSHRRFRRPRLIGLVPFLFMAAVGVGAELTRGVLPALTTPETVIRLVTLGTAGMPLGGLTDGLGDPQPVAIVASILPVALFFGGAFAFRVARVRGGPPSTGYLAIALLFAAFAEVQFAATVSVYSGLVTLGDLIRLGTGVTLFLGVIADEQQDIRRLAAANAAQARLAATEAERATLEERARIARDLHDGLSQQLWLAKLKVQRLVRALPDQDTADAREAIAALDAAIAEARGALHLVRADAPERTTLAELIASGWDEVADRAGIDLRLTSTVETGAELPPEARLEVARIVREALANVVRHADATVVRVTIAADAEALSVVIDDNGRGFDAERIPAGRLGITGMRERARRLGGTLDLESAQRDGTTVILRVPRRTAEAGAPVRRTPVARTGGVRPARPPDGSGALEVRP